MTFLSMSLLWRVSVRLVYEYEICVERGHFIKEAIERKIEKFSKESTLNGGKERSKQKLMELNEA